MLIKNLLAFLQPLGFIWLLLTLWLIVTVWRKRSQWSVWPASAWLIMTICTCTPFCSWMLAFLENDYPRIAMEQVPASDVIVCLGGGAEPSVTEMTGVHFKRTGDRITTAVMLANQKKGTVLVISGGVYKHEGVNLSEADATVSYLKRQQATDLRILSLGGCADTHDEALKIADLAQQHGWKSVVLVTSANHMARAVGTFAKAGLKVVPVPCNYLSSFNRVGDVAYFHPPTSSGFEAFSLWFHEVVGTLIYRHRGWID